MNCLASFEVIQISSFSESQLISRKFAACSLQSFSKVTSKYDYVSKVHPLIDVFVFTYVLFVFLDYREALLLLVKMCEKTRQQNTTFFALGANSCCADCNG